MYDRRDYIYKYGNCFYICRCQCIFIAFIPVLAINIAISVLKPKGEKW